MTAITFALRAALLHFLWQGLAVAFLLWVALFFLRKRSAQARYIASCAALGLMMLLPVATATLLFQSPAPPVPMTTQMAIIPAPSIAGIRIPDSAGTAWMVRLEPWALPLWSAGVLFFSLRLVWGCWRVAAMRRRGQPADTGVLAVVAGIGRRMGLARPVRVLTASLPDGPSVVGWLRPVLLLPPATILGLTPEQLEAVLAHELAHIRRYDHLVNAIQTLVETLLFYHPAVWWTSARIREERELCCDDLAVSACGSALCFARALTRLERLRVMTPATALGSTGGSLQYRVQRLIGVGPQECAPSKLSGILALSLGLIGLAASVQWVRAQEPAPRAQQSNAAAQAAGGSPRTTTSGDKVYSIIVADRETNGDDPGVSVDLGGASLLHRNRVEYPESAQNNGIQGTVAVQVSLDAAGNVVDARVVSGPVELRKAVMTSVFGWHFAQGGAGSTRIVNVAFQKPPARQEGQRGVPGVVVGVEPTTSRVEVADPVLANTSEQQAVFQNKAYAVTAENAARLEEARRRVQSLEGQLGSLEQDNSNSPDAVLARKQTEEQLVSSRYEMAALQGEGHGEASLERPSVDERRSLEHFQAAGVTLGNIEAPNLSESVKNDLLSRLPVHVGDTLTETALKSLGDAIHNFDEHIVWRLALRRDGTAVIHIEVPGGGRNR